MADTADDKKDAQESGKLTLHIREGDGQVTSFKMGETKNMKKLFEAYCKQMGKTMGMFRLVTGDGVNVQQESTPQMLKLIDNDVLDVLAVQVGGSY